MPHSSIVSALVRSDCLTIVTGNQNKTSIILYWSLSLPLSLLLPLSHLLSLPFNLPLISSYLHPSRSHLPLSSLNSMLPWLILGFVEYLKPSFETPPFQICFFFIWWYFCFFLKFSITDYLGIFLLYFHNIWKMTSVMC